MRKSLWYSLIGIIAVAVLALGATLAAGHAPLLGLDLQGGASVVLQPETKVSNSVLDQAISIINKRVDSLGVAEPNISRQGDTVVIELPGIKDPQRALSVIGQTAQLLFRPVLCTNGTGTSAALTLFPARGSRASTTTVPPKPLTPTTAPGAQPRRRRPAPPPRPSRPPARPRASDWARAGADGFPRRSCRCPPSPRQRPAVTPPTTPTTVAPTTSTTTPAYSSTDCQLANTNVSSELPTTAPAADNPAATVLLPAADSTGNSPDLNGARYLLGPSQLTGKVVSTASAQAPDANDPTWYVMVTFTSAGGPQFNTLAQKNYQQFVAIDLDGLVESAPQIDQTSYNGSAVINGASFTEGQAKNLALELRYGSLPVKFQAQSIETVSATIGQDSLTAGLVSGAIGLILVLLYMLFYYRALGVVVIIGLGLSGMLLYAIISQLSQSSGLSLSLAGATGIIVSVGVTADSYIVYFERLKDEIRSGKSVRTSVDRGFSRAYRTIVAADLVSIMAAVILYLFTVGSVRGFAFFLGLSTALDLITAFFFTRPMVALLGRNRMFTEAKFFGVARGLAATPPGGVQ